MNQIKKEDSCYMNEEILDGFRVLHKAQVKAIQHNTILLCLVVAFLIINMSVLLHLFLQ